MNGNISDLLREYGGSLEESRKLSAALKERQQPTGFTSPQIFDWEEAKQFGVTLDEGWMLKVTPDESERGFAVSYLSPGKENERWEITEGGLYISPEGKQYTEEELKAQEAQPQTEELFGKVFPGEDVQSILTYAEENPEEFYGELIKAGKTPDTEALLKAMGASEEYYNYLYMSDEERANWIAQIQSIGRNDVTEALVKSIKPDITEEGLTEFFTPISITKEEHETGIKGFFTSLYKGFRLGVKSTWENVKTAFSTVYPLGISSIGAPASMGGTITMPTEEQWKNPDELRKILPPSYFERYMANVRNDMPIAENIAYMKRDIEFWNEENRGLEANTKAKYEESQANFNEWLIEHPEFYEPEYLQSSIEHPELLKDPGYYGYTIGSTAPPMMAAFAAAIGTTFVTRNPLAGAAAGAALFDPINKASIYDDMMANGASPGVAANAANSIGTVVSAVEIVPELVFLRIVAPSFMRTFGRTFQKDLTKQVITKLSIAGTLKGTLTAGGKIMIAETAENLVQQVLQNAAVKTVNENRSLIEGLGDTFIQSVIAIAPFAIVGMGAEYLNMKANLLPEASKQIDDMASKLKAAGLSDDLAEAAALAKLMETEVGEAEVTVAMEKTVAPEVTKPITGITEQQWQSMGISERATLAKSVGLEGKVGSKNWADLTASEKDALTRVTPEIPKATPGMPEVTPVEPRLALKPETPASAPPGATGRIYNRIQFEPGGEAFTTKVNQGWHQFQVRMCDDLYAFKQFTEQFTKGGVELSIQENPYLLARLLRGIAGKIDVFITKGTFGKTFWKIEGGRAKPDYTGESLENILKEVKEPTALQDFSIYLVAQRAVELSKRNIETGIEVADAQASISELETKYPKFSNLAERLYGYQNRLLSYAQEMGIISEELLGKLRKYGKYVPFYRVFNELQSKGFMGNKMANIASPIKRIKGSEREIINPLESIIKNTYVFIESAERNQIGIMMANLVDKNPEITDTFERIKRPMARVAGVTAKELGIEIEGLSEEDAEAIVDIFRPSFFVRGDEVTVLIDGKKQYYRVDPELRDAFLNLDRETLGIVGRLLSLPAKWLRAGATLSPDFMVRNPMRDQLTAFCYSNYNFLPGIDFMRGLASLISKDTDYQLYRASGAEWAVLVSPDIKQIHKSFQQIVREKRFTDYVKHPLGFFQILSAWGETATRLGEFKAGIRGGATPLEAGYSARAVTLDFAQAGTTARAINQIIAFFNANLRGWGRMYSSFKEHPTRTAVKVFIGITLPSILLYFANRDDPRWKEIPQWQKDLFWIVFIGDNIYRIPKPFELGLIFGSIPERFLEYLDNKDPELFKETLINAAEAGSPGFIPTAMLPILEWMTNYSFFRGRALVPASRQKMPPELQYTQWTTEVSKKLGELLNLPPVKIENLILGWTGGLGRYAMEGVDLILKGTGIVPNIPEPSRTLADIPVIRAFVVRNPYGSSGETVDRFYDKLEKYEQGEKYLKEMLELGDEEKFNRYKASHPELLFFYDFEKDVAYSASARYLRRIAGDLSELGKEQDEIYKSTTLSPEEKRAKIDEIDILKTEIAHKTLDLLLGGDVLSGQIQDDIDKLGTTVEEVSPISLDKPNIYTMRNLHTDFGYSLQGVTKEDLDRLEGIDKFAYSYIAVKAIEKEIDPILNKAIYQIKYEFKEGYTFEDYYKQWQEGLVKDETLDNLSRSQIGLLREYYSLDEAEQKKFLEEHPELKENPRETWLITHPKENALLAIWGQTEVFTLEAYKEANRLIGELDIPGKAIEFNLPPATIIDAFFGYKDIQREFSSNSAEAKLFRLENEAFNEWGMEAYGWKPVEGNINALRLQVKWDDMDNQYNAIEGTEARKAFLSANPEYARARLTMQGYDLGVSDEFIDLYSEYYSLPAKGFDQERFLKANSAYYNEVWLGVLGNKPIDFSKVPTEEVERLYEIWSRLSLGQARRDFEASHPDLDMWLHIKFGTKLETES